MAETLAKPPRISLYVQHLLGIGHLSRAFRIGRALVSAGWDTEILIGGLLPAGFDTQGVPIVALPPVRADAGGLSTLVHPDGRVFDAAAQAQRRNTLLAHVSERRPEVLLIEAFPFGRRQMRFELMPLLDTVSGWPQRPLVVASVRDILQASHRPERAAETLALLDRFFDCVLVHGDPAMARLEDSFPAASGFAAKIAYTGIVAPPPATALARERFDVVVSVGGGAVGQALLRAALTARPLSAAAAARWLILTGPNLPADEAAALAAQSGGALTVASFVPDLASVLAQARLSISQAGYNTVADVLVAGCRAVLVPYAQAGETEQTLRAHLLARAGRAVVLAEADLAAASLAAAVDTALVADVTPMRLDLDGAARTAAVLGEALARHRSRILAPPDP